jgi:hypothetical protein
MFAVDRDFLMLARTGVSARQNSPAPSSAAPASPAEDVRKTAKPNPAIGLLPGYKTRVF